MSIVLVLICALLALVLSTAGGSSTTHSYSLKPCSSSISSFSGDLADPRFQALLSCLNSSEEDLFPSLSTALADKHSLYHNQEASSTCIPIAMVSVCSVPQTQRVMECSRLETPTASHCVYSSGHDYAARSCCHDGVVINVEGMQKVLIEEKSGLVIVEPGLPVGAMSYWLAAHNLMLPHGDCPTVAVGGHAIGGGFDMGYVRQHGMLASHIIGVKIVQWDGTVLTASDASLPDFMWACRGACRLFGVVVEITFQAKPASAGVTYLRREGTTRAVTEELVRDFVSYVKRDQRGQLNHTVNVNLLFRGHITRLRIFEELPPPEPVQTVPSTEMQSLWSCRTELLPDRVPDLPPCTSFDAIEKLPLLDFRMFYVDRHQRVPSNLLLSREWMDATLPFYEEEVRLNEMAGMKIEQASWYVEVKEEPVMAMWTELHKYHDHPSLGRDLFFYGAAILCGGRLSDPALDALGPGLRVENDVLMQRLECHWRGDSDEEKNACQSLFRAVQAALEPYWNSRVYANDVWTSALGDVQYDFFRPEAREMIDRVQRDLQLRQPPATGAVTATTSSGRNGSPVVETCTTETGSSVADE